MLTGGLGNWRINGNGAGLGIWAHQSERDTRAPFVAHHIPEADQTGYPLMAPISLMIPETLRSETIIPGETLIVAEVGGDEVEIDYVLSHTGMLTVDPLEHIEENTTYEVRLSGIQDAVKNVMEPYVFRFSTGSAVSGAAVAPTISAVNFSPGQDVLAGSTVTVQVDASSAEDDQLEYRFRRTGEEYSAWGSASSISYLYGQPGLHSVTVQVRDSLGQVSTRVANIAIFASLGDGQPTLYSSQIAYDSAFGSVWTINPDNDSLSRISSGSNSVDLEVETADDPRSVAVSSDGSVWVTASGQDLVQVFDANGVLLDSIDTGYGSRPYGILMNSDRSKAYISLYGSGSVARLDVSSRNIDGELELPSSTGSDMAATPAGLALTAEDGRLLVTRFISDQNWGEVYDINPASLTLNGVIRLEKSLEPDAIENGRGVPNYISSIVISDDGNWAYAVGKKDNVDRGLINGNDDLDDDNTVRTFAATINLETSEEVKGWRIDFDNADSPSSVALAPNGNYLFVGIQGRNQVWAVSRDPQTGRLGGVDAQFNTGRAPQGLLFVEDKAALYAKSLTDRLLTVIDLEGFISGGTINPSTRDIGTVSNEVLGAQELLGKQLFYDAAHGLQGSDDLTGQISAEGYISCASCHFDGGQDGRTYDFTGRGEGIRNNISLKGRMGTRFGDVHWSANFDEIHDFENDIRNAFLGRGLMTDADFASTSDPQGAPKAGRSAELDALAAYVSSLGRDSLPRSPHRTDSGALTNDGIEGERFFFELGCDGCHVGSAYTDAITHDVGTLREFSGSRLGGSLQAIKTPSLLGLFESAPYLHDGSAQTIDAVFSSVGGVVYQAELGARSGNTDIVAPADFSYYRGGSAVQLNGSGSLSLDVDGGAGGNGIVRVRYGSAPSSTDLNLEVNGTIYSQPLVALPQQENTDVAQSEVIFNVSLASNNNTITIASDDLNNNQHVIIDDVTVSTAEDVDAASAHTVARSLSASDMGKLVDFLQQIDRSSAAADNEDPFAAPRQNPLSDDGWTFCADEGDYCGFEGVANVRYGAQQQYNIAEFEGGVDCNNSVFGDPLQGVVKQCEFLPVASESTSTETGGSGGNGGAGGGGSASTDGGSSGGGSTGPLALILMALVSLLRYRRFELKRLI